MKTKKLILLMSFAIAFFCGIAQNQIVEAEYYLDQDPGFGSATSIDLSSAENISEAISADLGALDAGRYFAYVRVKGESDMWSIPLKVPFQIQKPDLPEITAAEWYIGDDPGFGDANSLGIDAGQEIESAAMASTVDLTAGRSFGHLRVQNADGQWSLPLKQSFFINDKFPLDVVTAEYFIDEDPGFGNGSPVDVDPEHFITESYMTEISADLTLGDHFLYTRVQNEEGAWSINIVKTFTVGTVSVEAEILLNSTKIYPIPTSDFLYVENDLYKILGVDIFDMSGQRSDYAVFSTGKVDMSGYAAGTYLVRINTAAGDLTKKILVR